MLARRFAMAIGLLAAVFASQLPEYVQQYRQRLGGAIDELKAIVAQFDAEAGRMSLTRSQGVERLHNNPDQLAQERGTAVEATAAREERLERQQAEFARSGPLSEYLVLLKDFDPGLARRAFNDFQPAVPVTSAGFIAGICGLVAGWGGAHALGWPLRRRLGRWAEARSRA